MIGLKIVLNYIIFWFVDVNECQLQTDSCHSTLGQCTNTEGAYTCSCLTGYQGDGITCTGNYSHIYRKQFETLEGLKNCNLIQ